MNKLKINNKCHVPVKQGSESSENQKWDTKVGYGLCVAFLDAETRAQSNSNFCTKVMFFSCGMFYQTDPCKSDEEVCVHLFIAKLQRSITSDKAYVFICIFISFIYYNFSLLLQIYSKNFILKKNTKTPVFNHHCNLCFFFNYLVCLLFFNLILKLNFWKPGMWIYLSGKWFWPTPVVLNELNTLNWLSAYFLCAKHVLLLTLSPFSLFLLFSVTH